MGKARKRYKRKSKILVIPDESSNSIKVTHTIIGPWTSGSFADYIQLKRYLRKIERGKFSDLDWYSRMKFNEKYLNLYLEFHGFLQCAYCGKDDLQVIDYKIKKNKELRKIMATADHFWPSSIWPNLEFDMNNLVVSCEKCNKRKSNKIYATECLQYYRPLPNQKLPLMSCSPEITLKDFKDFGIAIK
jgi:5-methylcytosine-specific restriction endonuclease McrA